MEDITYRELLDALKNLDEEDLDRSVNIHLRFADEYLPLAYEGDELVFFVDSGECNNDALEEGHPYLKVNY